MKTVYIGIDNGVTGSIGFINSDGDSLQVKTPVKKVMNYTKSVKRFVSRVEYKDLKSTLSSMIKDADRIICRVERPFINGQMFQASMSAARAHEATEICLEELKIPFDYIDSKKWQRALFPTGTTGKKELKLASKTIGERLYPNANVHSHPDCDGLLIAEYLKRRQN
jgi:hypothetical protein